jgi:four helix bundle protein
MSRIQTHRDLRVWRESLALAETVFRMTSQFPVEERYGLSAQLALCIYQG